MKGHNLILAGNLAVACSCGNQPREGDKLIIATAANMQFALEAIAGAFTANSGIPCDLTVASSGKLTAQIKAGAPFDIFLAANMMYPEAVYRDGYAMHPPRLYARGQLVLWTVQEGLELDIASLPRTDITHIALANPRTAPYGLAATEVLQSLGIFDSLKEKLVYGESITQTNQFILSGAAQVGFTALSSVKSPPMRGRGTWIEIDHSLYSPIEQGVVIIKRVDGLHPGAEEFYDFLFSDQAAEIIEEFGYIVHE